MKSTISLFRRLYEQIPPLFPEEKKVRMAADLKRIEGNEVSSINELENILISHGYEVWPWNEAYNEFWHSIESKMADHFFLPKLNKNIAEKYDKFKHYGGEFDSVKTGRAAQFFTSEERAEIMKALVEVNKELRSFVKSQITGVLKNKYLNRVAEFEKTLGTIRSILDELRFLADNENTHPHLSDQIRSRILSFEYGLCYLGPKPKLHDVTESVPFFKGRGDELKRLSAVLVVK